MADLKPENTDIEVAKMLMDHYQKTFELTYNLWEQRNRLFLMLLGIIGLATLLTFRVEGADSLFVELIASLLDINDPNRIEALRDSFPFELLQSIFLVVVFYLMVNLYHRSYSVYRNYHYLGKLESEIRAYLKLDDKVSFTREGDFYWTQRSSALEQVKLCYVLLLFLLLCLFLYGHFSNVKTNSTVILVVDIVSSLATAYYFAVYSLASIKLDKRPSSKAVKSKSSS